MDESDCTDPERRLWWNDPTLNLRLKECAAVSPWSPSSGSSALSAMDASEEMDMDRVGVDPNRNVVCGEPTYCMSNARYRPARWAEKINPRFLRSVLPMTSRGLRRVAGALGRPRSRAS